MRPVSSKTLLRYRSPRFKFFVADEPVIGDQHAGDRAQAARIAEQPLENITARIGKQFPRLHQNADDAGDQTAGAERDPFRKSVGEIVGGRNDVGGDIDRQRRDDDREHRDRDDDRLRKLADEFDRVPSSAGFMFGKTTTAADVIKIPIAAKTTIVVGSATICPIDLFALAFAEARKVRHVQRKRRPETDHRRQARNKDRAKFAERLKLAGLVQQEIRCRRPDIRSSQQNGRSSPKRYGAAQFSTMPQQIHPAINDRNVHRPKDQKRKPFGRRVPADRAAEQRRSSPE